MKNVVKIRLRLNSVVVIFGFVYWLESFFDEEFFCVEGGFNGRLSILVWGDLFELSVVKLFVFLILDVNGLFCWFLLSKVGLLKERRVVLYFLFVFMFKFGELLFSLDWVLLVLFVFYCLLFCWRLEVILDFWSG